jgi:anti-anti-sigma regulatory factor
MATQITQIDHPEKNLTVLRVEGDMLSDDAQLIGKIASCATDETGHDITIDLADLSFMDSEAASVLRKLSENGIVAIDGVEIFLQAAVDMAERA